MTKIKSFFKMAPFLILLLFASTSYADINSALIQAARGSDVTKVKQLLKQGADVNTKDEDGRTALMEAVGSINIGCTETVRTLIDAGADVNAKNKNGSTALMWAVIFPRTEVVKALIDAGADVNAKNKYGETALMSAESSGHTDTAEALIDAGNDSYYEKGILAVGFKKGVSQAIAEEILKSLNLKYRRTKNLNMGKRFFYKTGEKFLVRVPDGEELIWLEKLNKIPEIEATGLSVDPRRARID